MNKKKICIVGGAGFIGHNLALKLNSSGYQVLLIDSLAVNNYNSIVTNTDNVPNPALSKYILDRRMEVINQNEIPLLITDARDYHLLSRNIDNFKPDIIIQLAAVSHANRSNKDPYSTFDHSLRTLENALDIAKKSVEHFIYFSSSMVYGDFRKEIVSEEEVCDPIGIYGSLKYAGEIIVKSYANVFFFFYTIIRPSALYGERCVSRRVGQIFIENAIQGLDININGSGEDRLDFTYIEDLVEGISLCCEKESAKNETFNLTFGSSRKINELLEILRKEFKEVNVLYKEKEKFMPERGTLDVSKAKKLLGYNPLNPIDKGYVKYISWYKTFWNSIK